MMHRCPTCNQEIKSAAAAATVAAHVPPKAYVAPPPSIKFPKPNAFIDLCSQILSHPDCRDPEFRAALEKFSINVFRYRELTEKQLKFFKVMHQKVLGTWPSDSTIQGEDAVPDVKPAAKPLPADDQDIPF